MPARSRAREALLATLMVLASVVAGLVLLELGIRIARGPQALTDWHNIVRQERVFTRSVTTGKAIYDPLLGFVGTPSHTDGELHFDAQGFRITPAPAGVVLKEPPLLVVGGSFTLGHDVADDETYPARLQALSSRRTINAGMAAYGLDQIVLRAETVAAAQKPAAVVLGFGADNLRRMEMSRVWGVEKPYFTQAGDTLALQHVPVPPSPDPATTLDIWQKLFGRSLLVDTLLRHFGWQYEWSVDHVRALPPGEGVRMTCPLFKRLATLGLPGIVAAEYDPWIWSDPALMREHREATGRALRCAQAAGFVTVDPFDTIDAAMKSGGLHVYYGAHDHPNPAGQTMIAKLIADALPKLGL